MCVSVKTVYEQQFLGRRVDIGIPSFENSRKTFFITGTVLSVEEDYLLLETYKGIRRINFADIIEIQHETGRGG